MHSVHLLQHRLVCTPGKAASEGPVYADTTGSNSPVTAPPLLPLYTLTQESWQAATLHPSGSAAVVDYL